MIQILTVCTFLGFLTRQISTLYYLAYTGLKNGIALEKIPINSVTGFVNVNACYLAVNFKASISNFLSV